ncbi:MAG: hypothetical protein KAT47_00915 [Candidatus Aegiribacteria sp.]|nr:hypothetical protein [Candidatus Aegiribacteria sp.]
MFSALNSFLRKSNSFVLLITVLCVISICIAQGETILTADTEMIDLYDPEVGEFLDLDINALVGHAWESYLDQDYEAAARFYLAYLRYNARDGKNIYNLACCYGLLGETQLAADYLIRAFYAGYDDLDWAMQDTDFDAVRDDPVFEVLFDSLSVIHEEQQAAIGSIRYVESTVLLNCYVQIPEDYDQETACPLLVGLHGYGSSANMFIQLWERFDNPDFIYASPQAPYPFSTGKDVGYSWKKRELEDDELSGRADMATLGYIISTVEMLKSQFNVSDVYLLGFSQGCSATYITGIKYYNMFNGLICFGGWLDTTVVSTDEILAAADLPFFIAHGKDDGVVAPEAGTSSRDHLENLGCDVTFVDFDGGHEVPEEVLQQVQNWMKE